MCSWTGCDKWGKDRHQKQFECSGLRIWVKITDIWYGKDCKKSRSEMKFNRSVLSWQMQDVFEWRCHTDSWKHNVGIQGRSGARDMCNDCVLRMFITLVFMTVKILKIQIFETRRCLTCSEARQSAQSLCSDCCPINCCALSGRCKYGSVVHKDYKPTEVQAFLIIHDYTASRISWFEFWQ